jgi:hypothetical protein
MQSAISDGLAQVPTGPELCALLPPVRLEAVPEERLLELLSAQWRQLSYQQAQVWAVLAEIASRDPMPNLPGGAGWTPEQIFDSAVDEVRAELRLTRRAARRELEHADAVTALPQVAQALAAGVIDRARAIVLADGCLDLTEAQQAKLLDELLPEAAAVTATGLAERVRRVAIALDPGWAERRYRAAVRERRLIGYLNHDGSATVSGQYLPADQAAAACARVDLLAAAAKRAGSAARIDHLRAELFMGLLGGRFHGMTESAIAAELLQQFPPHDAAEESTSECDAVADENDTDISSSARRGVELRVGLGTLLGLDEQPGEIAGWGPVTSAVAREIAARQRRSEWRFAILDENGELLFDGLTRRRPGTAEPAQQQAEGGIVELHVPLTLLSDSRVVGRYPAWAGVLADLAAQYARQRPIEQDPAARFPGRPLRRHSQIQYQRCIFPGCRRPATGCDLDHRRDHARGGRTVAENLGPGCRHDHMNKTARGWRLIRIDERTFEWISPLGRRHVVHLQPVAPPLPPPCPRKVRDGPSPPDDDLDDSTPTFAPRTRRGRPLVPAVDLARDSSRLPESDPDPPPF